MTHCDVTYRQGRKVKLAMSLEATWSELIRWLSGHRGFENNLIWRDVPGKGRGLVATRRMNADEKLLVIPASAMINPLTLAHNSPLPEMLFPDKTTLKRLSKKVRTDSAERLNTTQLLTLYMASLRASPGTSECGAYLATLPQSFRPWHPLTWLYPSERAEDDGDWWSHLAKKAPKVAQDKLKEVNDRYKSDVLAIRAALNETCASLPTISTEDLLWGWLIVNTRTVSIPLGLGSPTELYNHTLVPLLDLINHTSDPALSIPKPRQIPTPGTLIDRRGPPNDAWHLVPGKIAFELVAPTQGMHEGEEVFFSYGSHDAATLWSEYGFVESANGERENRWECMPYGGVNVGSWVEKLWEDTDAETREKKKRALESISCWKRDVLYTQPLPPSPSHGLLMSLRVHHLDVEACDKLPAISRGEVTLISPKNEAAALSSLDEICAEIVAEAKLGSEALHQISGLASSEEREDAVKTLNLLFDEQAWIAGKIRQRIRNGDDLS